MIDITKIGKHSGKCVHLIVIWACGMTVSSTNEYGTLCNCYSRSGVTQPDKLILRPLPKLLSLMVEGHPLSPLTMQVTSLLVACPIWEGIKPGTERNRMERNRTGSCAQYRRRHRICYGKLVLICQAYQCTES